MDKGWVGREHGHVHDQVVYVVHGYLRVTCENETFELRTGDSFVVRGGVQHGGTAIEDTLVVVTRARHTGDLHGEAPLLWCASAFLR